MALISTACRNKTGNKNPTRYYSDRQEKQVVKNTHGMQTKNSGATPFQKGDVMTDKFLIECKTKTHPSESMSIKKEWLEKNKQEAFAMRKMYNTLCFDYGDNGTRYYIVDEKTFIKMKEALEDGE